MSLNLLEISLGSAVFGNDANGRLFTSFVCGLLFFEERPFALVLKSFRKKIGASVFSAPTCLENSSISDPEAADQQRQIDLSLIETEFAAFPLAKNVLIDEEQDYASRSADLEIGAAAKIEGVDAEGFYVCALKTHFKDKYGEMLTCAAMLSRYDGSEHDMNAGLLGRRVLCDERLLGVITATNADKRLAFLSLLDPMLERVYKICGIEGGRFPEKIGDWNSEVVGERQRTEEISAEDVLELFSELTLAANIQGNLTPDDLKELRDNYRAAIPEDVHLFTKAEAAIG